MPSGLKWAKNNLGATKPWESGKYFSWGNTDGYYEGSDYDFSQETYDNTPGAEIEGNITANEDAARVELGEHWRMPSESDINELLDNCTSEWISFNGINGRKFTSNLNGRTIFIPAAGGYVGKTLSQRGSRGDYWLTSFVDEGRARYFAIESANAGSVNNNARHRGFTIRPVFDPNL